MILSVESRWLRISIANQLLNLRFSGRAFMMTWTPGTGCPSLYHMMSGANVSVES